MRNEGIIILEWVAHYRALGFDTIIIYTNNNDDGSDDLLLSLHHAGIIKLYKNIVGPQESPQFKAYRHAFWLSQDVWEHEWITFLDADEFLIPLVDGKMVSIHDYIEHIEHNYQCSAVSLNWRWFGGECKLERKPGLLSERFRNASWHDHVKTLFKLRDAVDVHIHCPKLRPDCKVIGGSGKVREWPSHAEEPDGSLGQINHYWNRSFQEFYAKRQRGRGADERAPRPWSLFFSWAYEDATPDPYPDHRHIERVYTELKSLRKIRAIRRARRAVERHFRHFSRSPSIEATYAATLAEITSGKTSEDSPADFAPAIGHQIACGSEPVQYG
jgi:hypothetical protein